MDRPRGPRLRVGIDVVLFHAKAAKNRLFILRFHASRRLVPLLVAAIAAAILLLAAASRGRSTTSMPSILGKLIHERHRRHICGRRFTTRCSGSVSILDANSTGRSSTASPATCNRCGLSADWSAIQLVILVLSAGVLSRLHDGSTWGDARVSGLYADPVGCNSDLFASGARHDRTREPVPQVVLTLAENVQGVHVVRVSAAAREIAGLGSAVQAVEDQQQQIF